MAKLYFKYGSMGSSKTANALMTRFNYEEKGKNTLLLKPAADIRDGETILKSRIGLEAKAVVIGQHTDIKRFLLDHFWLKSEKHFAFDVIIVDEVQFFSKEQIVTLRNIASYMDIPVICYGLRTNFKGELFEGSKALFELADSIQEIKTICKCGSKAIINVLFDEEGKVVTESETDVIIGGNEKYEAMCWHCYQEKIKENKNAD